LRRYRCLVSLALALALVRCTSLMALASVAALASAAALVRCTSLTALAGVAVGVEVGAAH
jgi:hypothetical protein